MKNILFIAPEFFSYSQRIKKIIEHNKYGNVDYISHIPKLDYFFSFCVKRNKILRNFYCYIFSIYIICLLYFKKSRSYDECVIILGRLLHPVFFKWLRKIFPKIKIIMYQWDSINNYPDIIRNINLVDAFFTFDYVDYQKYNQKFSFVKFLPLFSLPEYKFSDEQKKYELTFIGALHSERYNLVTNILEIAGNKETYAKFYVRNLRNRKAYEKKFALTIDENLLTYDSLTSFEIANIFKESKVIIDINNKDQSGLTMRTFESLSAGCRLITTNSNIKKYDFYDEKYICVIDREKPDYKRLSCFLDFEINDEDHQVISNRMNGYCVNKWVDNILL